MSHDYRDVLLKAASIVEEGWTQTFHVDAQGQCCGPDEAVASCAMGAIQRASMALGMGSDDRDDYMGETTTKTALFLADCLGLESLAHIAGWNDTLGRTADEVAAAMREAAS